MPQPAIEDLIVVFGPSGAGKRTITGLLEDHHHFVAVSKVDPSSMVPLVRDHLGSSPFWRKLLINVGMEGLGGSDLKRSTERYVNDSLKAVHDLQALVGGRLRVLFLYCEQATLLKRQTYGHHPLLAATGSIEAAIFKECEILIRLFGKLADSSDLAVRFLDTTIPVSMGQLRPRAGYAAPSPTRRSLSRGLLQQELE